MQKLHISKTEMCNFCILQEIKCAIFAYWKEKLGREQARLVTRFSALKNK